MFSPTQISAIEAAGELGAQRFHFETTLSF
jgi:hypothetical protein